LFPEDINLNFSRIEMAMPDVSDLRIAFRYAKTGLDGISGLPAGMITNSIINKFAVSDLPEKARDYFNSLKDDNVGFEFGKYLIENPEYVIETKNNMEKPGSV
jgi:hypothetical protein